MPSRQQSEQRTVFGAILARFSLTEAIIFSCGGALDLFRHFLHPTAVIRARHRMNTPCSNQSIYAATTTTTTTSTSRQQIDSVWCVCVRVFADVCMYSEPCETTISINRVRVRVQVCVIRASISPRSYECEVMAPNVDGTIRINYRLHSIQPHGAIFRWTEETSFFQCN